MILEISGRNSFVLTGEYVLDHLAPKLIEEINRATLGIPVACTLKALEDPPRGLPGAHRKVLKNL